MICVMSLLQAVLVFFSYLGIHYACAYTLPLSPAAYTIVANLTAIALSAAVCLFRRRDPLTVVGARKMSLWQVTAALAVGVGACLLVRLMMLTVPFPESWNHSYASRVEAIREEAPLWLTYVSSVVVAPFAEEWVFRGLLYRSLKNGMPRWIGMLLSSVVFAALHGTIVWMLYTFFLGLLLCVLYECTRSLWACVLCHVAFNITGQIPFIGILPDAVSCAIFLVGAILFAVALYYLYKANRSRTSDHPEVEQSPPAH